MPKTQTSLARAHFDAGNYAEVLATAGDDADGVLTKSCAFYYEGEYAKARDVLNEIAPTIDTYPPPTKALFYGQRAACDSKLGKTDFILIDYEAAIYWAVKSGDKICHARARNNIAKIYSNAGRLDEALGQVDGAIYTARSLNELALMGNFLDQKAQILLDHERFEEAMSVARKAVETLELHGNATTLDEARNTLGKVFVSAGIGYLSDVDSFEDFKFRREAAQKLNVSLDVKIAQKALAQTDGHVYQAATLLGIKHPSLIKMIKDHGLKRHPKRRTSLINKK